VPQMRERLLAHLRRDLGLPRGEPHVAAGEMEAVAPAEQNTVQNIAMAKAGAHREVRWHILRGVVDDRLGGGLSVQFGALAGEVAQVTPAHATQEILSIPTENARKVL